MDKYKKMKKQVSTDGGQTWQDVIPYVYQKGALIESDSPDCNNITWVLVDDEYICEQTTEPMTEWRTVSGEYVCTGYDKYTKEAEYRSLDGGSTWTATGNERTGSMIESNSSDCNYPGDTECYATQGGNMSMGYTSVVDSQGIHYKYDFTDMDNGCYYRESDAHTSVNNRANINYPMPMEWFFPDCTNGVAFGLSILFAVDPEESTFPVSYKYVFGSCDGITQTVLENQTGIGVNQCATSTMRMSNIAVTQPDYWNCITKISDGVYTFAGVIQKDNTSKAIMRFNFDTVNKTVSNISITVSCLHKQYRRVPVADSFICIETDKYQAVHVYESDDDGETWTDMGIQAGLLIEADSADCGVQYRWVADSGYECVGFDKYNKEKQQMSYDGEVWEDTGVTRAGSTLIEADSEDCGYVPPVITRWVTVPNDYVCVGVDKYNKEKEQESTDGGQTWTDTGNTRAGNTLIEANSYDCGYVSYRWVTVSGEYECVGYDKYNKEKEQRTTDGINWTDTGNTRAGSTLIEANSVDCGYVPSAVKATITYQNGDTYYVPYNGMDEELSVNEVKRNISDTTDPHHYTKITGVIIHGDVVDVNNSLFDGCSNLSSVTINDSVKHIGQEAFRNCSSLTSITIPDGVTSIGYGTFKNCTGLTSVTIPNSVTSIDDNAFYGCTGLTSVTIPNSVKSIGVYAFKDCTNLTTFTIPNSVTNIDSSSFENTAWFNSQPFETIIYKDGWCLNRNYYYPTGSFSIQSGTKGIANYALSGIGNPAVTTITIPNSVVIIGEGAFNEASITSITIPNSVTTIGRGAFMNCSDLTTFNIPNSVTSIGGSAFYDWVNTQPDGIIYKDNWCLGYKGSEPTGSITIQSGTRGIADWAFEYCKDLTSVTLPSSILYIGNYAFEDCDGLTSLTLPSNLISIGNHAFEDCNEITGSLSIPNSVTSIGGNAFRYTNFTGSLVIPNSVTSIGSFAFDGCYMLTSLTIPSTISAIRWSTFEYCSGLTGSLVIPNGVMSIGERAFFGCSGLTSVTIPSSVTKIGYNAFEYTYPITLTCLSTTPPVIECPLVNSSLANADNIYVPAASVSAYQSASGWSTYASRIQAIP